MLAEHVRIITMFVQSLPAKVGTAWDAAGR